MPNILNKPSGDGLLMVTFIGGPRDLERKRVSLYGGVIWVVRPLKTSLREFTLVGESGTQPWDLNSEKPAYVRGMYQVEQYQNRQIPEHLQPIYVAFWIGWEDGSA